MPWYGPTGDCSCRKLPPCLCADPGEHELDVILYDPPFAPDECAGYGTYIKATVSGLQSAVDFAIAEAVSGGTLVYDYRFVDLDKLNGVHYYLINNNPCIPVSFVDHGTSDVLTDEVIIPPFTFRRFDIGEFDWKHLLTTGFDTSCNLTFEDVQSGEIRFGTASSSRVIFSRDVLNDIEITYELRGAGKTTSTPYQVIADASIKCSENFSPAEVPIFASFAPYTLPACSPARVVTDPFQIGTLKMELARLKP
jgi:hypothetical protein